MKLIISNHKMNLTLEEIKEYVKQLETVQSKNNLLIFCPSFLYLPYFTGKNYLLGSQNVASQTMGPLTGEVSIEQLKSSRVRYVIVGHSERRIILGEDLDSIQKKIILCLKNGITPILCIGEQLEERNKKEVILKEALDSAFPTGLDLEKIIIAYEPLWSIGTGIIPNNEEIDSTFQWIKSYIKDKYNISCKVVYGGSVNEKNIRQLNMMEIIDGYLIGGTSLKIEKLREIVEILEG